MSVRTTSIHCPSHPLTTARIVVLYRLNKLDPFHDTFVMAIDSAHSIQPIVTFAINHRYFTGRRGQNRQQDGLLIYYIALLKKHKIHYTIFVKEIF